MELPLGETFQPYIAAVTSPSLFYLVAPVHGQNTRVFLSLTNNENHVCFVAVIAV